MASYWSRELLLAELGEKPEWRRLYRSLVHYVVKHTMRCYRHLKNEPFTYSQIKKLLRACSKSFFGVETRKEYFDFCSKLQAEYQSAEGKEFAGHNDLLRVSE